ETVRAAALEDLRRSEDAFAGFLADRAFARALAAQRRVMDDEALARPMFVDRRGAAVHQRRVPNQYFAARGIELAHRQAAALELRRIERHRRGDVGAGVPRRIVCVIAGAEV